jgi:hypothetical protein
MKRILDKYPRSFDDWKFAARHSLLELEQYQREEDRNWECIKFVLTQYDGLRILLNQGISMEVLCSLVAVLAAKAYMPRDEDEYCTCDMAIVFENSYTHDSCMMCLLKSLRCGRG